MDQAIKKKWVDALLSGKYEQAEETLWDGQNGYCCLGVAAKACLRMSNEAIEDINSRDSRPYEDDKGLLHPKQRRAMGLTLDVQQELARLNDEGVPFEMIAGLIDEAL